MARRIVIYPYKIPCESAIELKEEFRRRRYEAIVARPDGNYRPREDDFIINWGMRTVPNWNKEDLKVLNHWNLLKRTVNKKQTLRFLSGWDVPCVPWTTDIEVARDWFRSEVPPVIFARQRVQGMLGQGITIIDSPEGFVDAKLYTKHVKGEEYRVHVVNGKVRNYQKKLRRRGMEVHPFIKTEENGWAFARQGIGPLPPSCEEVAIKGIKALNINFGGVDIIHTTQDNQARILEVNSAPGIVKDYGTEAYVNAFVEML